MKHQQMTKKFARASLALSVAGVLAASTSLAGHAVAASNTDLTQTINAGTLAVDIVNSSYVSVGSPSVPFSAGAAGFTSQTTTGTLGTSNERVYIKNPDAADNGWRVDIAASATTALWTSVAASATYDFNDPNSATDGADTDTKGGQLTVNPAAGAKNNGQSTAQCSSDSGISLGDSEAFSETGTVNSEVDLISGNSSSGDIIDCYVTGVGMSQVIPKEQAAASDYALSMTLTVTAL